MYMLTYITMIHCRACGERDIVATISVRWMCALVRVCMHASVRIFLRTLITSDQHCVKSYSMSQQATQDQPLHLPSLNRVLNTAYTIYESQKM